MLNKVMRKARKTLGTMKDHPAAVELRAREKLAFEILHPQVELVKRSPTAQILAGTALTAAILTGHWGTAAAIAGGWFGSKPLTHAVAGGVAGVGMVCVAFFLVVAICVLLGSWFAVRSLRLTTLSRKHRPPLRLIPAIIPRIFHA